MTPLFIGGSSNRKLIRFFTNSGMQGCGFAIGAICVLPLGFYGVPSRFANTGERCHPRSLGSIVKLRFAGA